LKTFKESGDKYFSDEAAQMQLAEFKEYNQAELEAIEDALQEEQDEIDREMKVEEE
jgi:hypothetical protein